MSLSSRNKTPAFHLKQLSIRIPVLSPHFDQQRGRNRSVTNSTQAKHSVTNHGCHLKQPKHSVTNLKHSLSSPFSAARFGKSAQIWSRTDATEAPKRASPATSQIARKQKTPGTDPDSSPYPSTRSPKGKSTKIIDRRSCHNT